MDKKRKNKTRRQFYIERIVRDAKAWLDFVTLLGLNAFIWVGMARILHIVYVARHGLAAYWWGVIISAVVSLTLWMLAHIIMLWTFEAISDYRERLKTEYDSLYGDGK